MSEWLGEGSAFAKGIVQSGASLGCSMHHAGGDRRLLEMPSSTTHLGWSVLGLWHEHATSVRAWPRVVDAVAILKMGGHLDSLLADIEHVVAGPQEDCHLGNIAWAFELREDRSKRARSLRLSSGIASVDLTARSAHWPDGDCADVVPNDGESLRLHAHVCSHVT